MGAELSELLILIKGKLDLAVVLNIYQRNNEVSAEEVLERSKIKPVRNLKYLLI